MNKVANTDIFEILMVVSGSITPAIKKKVAELKKYKIDIFLDIDLIINITKHKLVPKHTPLTKEEKKQLLEKQ